MLSDNVRDRTKPFEAGFKASDKCWCQHSKTKQRVALEAYLSVLAYPRCCSNGAQDRSRVLAPVDFMYDTGAFLEGHLQGASHWETEYIPLS